MIRQTWPRIKSYIDATSCPIHYLDDTDSYSVYIYNGNFQAYTVLNKDGGADVVEFETSYKSLANKAVHDSSGRMIIREASTEAGWHFQRLNMRFTGCKDGALWCEDKNGNDLSVLSVKFYDDIDATTANELSFQETGHESETQVQFQARLDAGCYKTEVKLNIPFDYEIMSGEVCTLSDVVTDSVLHVTAAPHIPAEFGGDVRFIVGESLKGVHRKGNNLRVDGRSPKMILNDDVNFSDIWEFVINHDPGDQEELQMTMEFFKDATETY